ncbi:S1 family peptidase [Microbacterium abyssi]|uniref:S1 family peptidase n=1 Tax=Microbacterium abyssi TaxID=2782166 RepID=UPI001887E87F|nr:serine protease [Microbacterium sp. A18JL241]
MQVYRGGRPVGRAICVAPRILLTAGHVVGDTQPGDLGVSLGLDEPRVAVIFTRRDADLDVAILHVDGDFDVSPVRRPSPAELWHLEATPGDARPDLTGTITSVRRSRRNAYGRSVPALQLRVDQTLQDFHGYSGAAVTADDDNSAVAVLVEQQPATARGRSSGFANVLYAIAIPTALEALGVHAQIEVPARRGPLPSSLLYHDEVIASLRGYRSRLTSEDLRFVRPPQGTPWSPDSLWSSLSEGGTGSVLLVGHGGVGKTRTLLEVGDIAAESGWDVIHVRGGNAARVADTISERVRDPAAAPVLLLLDYLNLARELDLLALTEIANAASSSPRLRLLATSRTGWELRHRHDAGMSRFSRVFLAPTEQDARDVCLAIVREIAPSATTKFGAATVLDLTGSHRPILAVLLGQVVEAQVVTTGDLPAALVSEDIASWLDDRLLEDDILPTQASAGEELPSHMLVAAVCLASAPASADALLETALCAVEGASRELVAVTLERLRQLGWLIDVDHQLSSAHDVVVDKILEAAVLHHSTGIVRESALATVLRTALNSPAPFANVIASLERVLDERVAQDLPIVELRSRATHWLMQSSEAIAEPLRADTAGSARVAAQILESELWSNDLTSRWVALGSSLLGAVENSPLAAEPLLVACRSLEKDVSPSISDRAVAWIVQQGSSVDEFVMNACLTRKDVSSVDSETLVSVALQSLEPRWGEVSADFTLRRLLRRPELSASDLTTCSDYIRGWLESFGETEHAIHLLSAVVDRTELRQRSRQLWDHAWGLTIAWIQARPHHIDGAFALESLLGSENASSDFDSDLWPLVADWLSARGTEPPAVYVLESLLKTKRLEQDRHEFVIVSVESWVAANLGSKATSFLLKPLIAWEQAHRTWSERIWNLVDSWLAVTTDSENSGWVLRAALRDRPKDDPVAPRIWPHIRRWLLQHGNRFDAGLVLSDALKWGYLGEGVAAVLWECVEKWLPLHASGSTGSHLFQAALRWEALDAARATRLFDLIFKWLKHGTVADSVPYVLQASVEYVTTTGRALPSTIWDRAIDWLDGPTSSSGAAAHLLRKMLQSPTILEDHAEEIVGRATIWLEQTPDGQPSVRLARTLIAALPATPSASLGRAEAALTHCIQSPQLASDYETGQLIQELADRSTTETMRRAIWSAASQFLATDNGIFGGYVLQAVLRNPAADEGIPDSGWVHLASWLTRFTRERHLIYSLIALVEYRHLTDSQTTELWERIQEWLSAHQHDAKIRQLIFAAFSSPRISSIALKIIWPFAAERFGTLAARLDSRHLLGLIASVDILDDAQLSTLWACVSRWLDRFGEHRDATFLLQPLLRVETSRVHEEILWNHVERWLQAQNEHWTTAYLYVELIDWAGLRGDRVATALSLVQSWLGQNPTARTSTRVVLAVVRSSNVSHRQLEAFGPSIYRWLAAQPNGNARRNYLRATNSRGLSKNRRSVALSILRASRPRQ